ncbi:MAG: hypothetical protein M1832_000494 [Thelocarpon impressellum]|nr:MAG: hypothetical protein M1832_000494 [Thelocarpon impressellum]
MDVTSSLPAGSGPKTTSFPPVNSSSAVPYLTSTLGHLRSSASNASSFFIPPSPMDLVLAIPRMAHRAGTFAFFTLPEHIDTILGNRYGRRVIPEATGEGLASVAAAASGAAFAQAQDAAGSVAGATAAASGQGGLHGGVNSALGFNSVRGFGGVLSYLTSKWALSCFTMALILNRTQVYASARRQIRLSWWSRLALRIIPISIFLYQTLCLLQAMRCQTSPDFSALRYNDPMKKMEHDYSGGGGPLYWLSSKLLFWEDDGQSCVAIKMTPRDFVPKEGVQRPALRGSLALMWPLFQSLCLSQFVETLSCAVQGRLVMAETGMTIFEHSLAFAEAESMVSNQLVWGGFGLTKASSDAAANTYQSQAVTAASAVSRSAVLDRLNTPPEVLLIGLLSSLSHLTSQTLAVLGLQGKYRLLSTGFWGLCFMTAFLWSLLAFTPGPSGDMGILRFPTVCIVGFIPHMLILMGIFTCAGIYVLALLLSATSPPGPAQPRSLKERFVVAQQNLQANIQLSSIRVNMHEDFYTSLLKIGFSALTAASEAVFLNEGQPVGVRPWTWLEEDRMKEIESARSARRSTGFAMPQDLVNGDSATIADGVGLVEESVEGDSLQWKSGYARERTTEKLKSGKSGKTRMQGDGVGAAERSGRWIMAWELFRGIFWLLVGGLALLGVKSLDSVGVRRKPRWLSRLAHREKATEERKPVEQTDSKTLEFWLLSEEGKLSLPEDEQVDVEIEMRKRLRDGGADRRGDDDELESSIYGWWKQGGWFGELDASGQYEPEGEFDDTTSVVSTVASSEASDGGWDTDGGVASDGRRTPTQTDPFPRSHESSDDVTMDLPQLARLLDPRNSEDRREAQLLAHHLDSPRIVTRSRFRQSQEQQRARVLTSTRYRPANMTRGSNKLSDEEEAELLEHLILSRRSYAAATASSAATDPFDSNGPSWATGAEGLGAGGPQCVVCQSSPRTILVWPCRCLNLCEDCRVSLAMNNFGNCVCCRRDVVGFSRIYVP